MYYNFKFAHDETICIQCFNEKTYGDMMLRLLKDYDSTMFRYMRGKIGGLDSDELYIFRKALPKCFLKLVDSQKNDICKVCSNNGNCKEHAELCCPITLDGYSYGVVGLIAFNKEQSDIITDNAKDLTNFLGKMADLISNKLKAQIKTEELELEKKKLEILLNSMNKAVVSIDKEGNIDKYNVKFKEIFNMRDDNIDGENIFQLLDFIKKPSTNDLKKHKTGVFYERIGI